ncbi:MAG: hypothetical protein ABMA14_26940 [Hyphomonadaceae bacterium]
MRRNHTFGGWLIDCLSCLVIVIVLLIGLGGPALGGLWFYSVLGLPPIALWIGGIGFVVFPVIFVMFLYWLSSSWPQPLRNALNKVLEGLPMGLPASW